MAKPIITQEYVRSLFDYDAETGFFTWRERPREHFDTPARCEWWNRNYSGKRAGAQMKMGYRIVAVSGKRLYEHRLAWLITYGRWPRKHIDHSDHNPANNAISNLREADSTQNGANQRVNSRNTSGFKGVYFQAGKWVAFIGQTGKYQYLGRHATKEEAAAAYAAAAKITFGEFAYQAPISSGLPE